MASSDKRTHSKTGGAARGVKITGHSEGTRVAIILLMLKIAMAFFPEPACSVFASGSSRSLIGYLFSHN